MVLRGMDLLLECIASGVYVQSAPSSSPAPGRMGGHQSTHLEAHSPVHREREASKPVSRPVCVCHPHPTLAGSALGKDKRQWLVCCKCIKSHGLLALSFCGDPVAKQPSLNRKAQLLEGVHLPPGPKSTFRISGYQAY